MQTKEHMAKQFPTPQIESYKGFELRTTPNKDAFTTLVYKDGIAIGGSFSTPLDVARGNGTSIEKAKYKIDAGHYNA